MWSKAVFIVLLFVDTLMLTYVVLMDKYYGGGFLYFMLSVVFVAIADIYYEIGRRLSGAFMLVLSILLALKVVV